MSSLQSRILLLEERLNTFSMEHQPNPVPLTALSDADRAILDSISYVDSTFIPKVEFYFQKAVTFANDVIFQSRVIFSDPDMAGQVSIQPGDTSIRVVFDRPYP